MDQNNNQKLKDKLKVFFQSAEQAFQLAGNSSKLYELKTRFMGSKSDLQKIMKEMKNLAPEEKPIFGKWLNEKKQALEESYLSLFHRLKKQELEQRMKEEVVDISLPGPSKNQGGLHPVQLIIQQTVNIFKSLGYSVRTGPMIESDWNNFQALNIPINHPSRDLQDTFYIDSDHVLRTHTSPIQVRSMLAEKPPLAILAPGKVFRRDNDVSHSPTFHQVEGMFIDRHVSMAHLKGTLSYFVKTLFGSNTRVRFRSSYFPFTEPSAEYDCSCPICERKGCSMCQHSGWMEIGGCGLMHPKVLALSHINPEKWEGFAFGLGVERLAIVYYGIPHIKLFLENDIRFLEQFSY
ncbi:MAG: phenylalanine--tRNA ligase subunit alpha [Bdellovibrionales bacterium]|nr:phenylalanine--tRNA ligase subunit alpha [Bdellovibrionales bacterium]